RKPYPGWIACAPVVRAAAITASMSRYDSTAGAGPMRTLRSASSTCGAEASASLYTATLRMPSARSVRMMRRAISPRFATSTVGKSVGPGDRVEPATAAEEVIEGMGSHPEEAEAGFGERGSRDDVE